MIPRLNKILKPLFLFYTGLTLLIEIGIRVGFISYGEGITTEITFIIFILTWIVSGLLYLAGSGVKNQRLRTGIQVFNLILMSWICLYYFLDDQFRIG